MKLPIELIEKILMHTDYLTYSKFRFLCKLSYNISKRKKYKSNLRTICERDLVVYLNLLPRDGKSQSDVAFLNWIYPERQYLKIYLDMLVNKKF